MKTIEQLWATGVSGMLLDEEAETLYRLVQSLQVPGPIVEIGSFRGLSTLFLAGADEERMVYAVDPHEGRINEDRTYAPTLNTFRRNVARAGLRNVVPLVMTSVEANYVTLDIGLDEIAMLFIDGLHDKLNGTKDWIMWQRRVVPGGIVAAHDVFRPAHPRYEGSRHIGYKWLVRPYFRDLGRSGSMKWGVKIAS